jgi:hypothetical protein
MRRFIIGASAIVAALTFGLVLFGASGAPRPMPRDDFMRVVRAMQSIAHETGLFAEQLIDERLSAPFARSHRDNLADILGDERDKLDDTLPRELQQAGESARNLAARLDASLAEMQRSLADRDALARIRADVRRVEEGLARLEQPS